MFDIDKEYPRDALLSETGSKQQQSGIIWGPKNPDIVIVTSGGRHKSKNGYQDKKLADGSWLYIGQGSKGNQDISRHSNSLIAGNAKSVLLFTTREPTAKEIQKRASYAKRYRFEGIFMCKSWELITPEIGSRKGDMLICFRLIPLANSNSATYETIASTPDELNNLRRDLVNNLGGRKTMPTSFTQIYERSKLARTYALSRAQCFCELCSTKAPFKTKAGNHFLEVHHIEHVAKGGLDHPTNLAALCPNCHRAVHYSNAAERLVSKLRITVDAKEAE